jgi:uncharacterized sporulation protein YeaH/YhbH (DUF444 family)
MEALLKKEGTVESWNDERMDELSRRVDSGFRQTHEEVREGFAEISRKLDRIPTREEIDHRFEGTEGRINRVNNRLEHMVWALFAIGGGLLGNVLAGNF